MIDPTTDDLDGLISDLTGGLGAHVVCEAVGIPALVGQAIRLTRPRGNVQLVGVNPAGSTLPADLFDMHLRELTIRGGVRGRRGLPQGPGLIAAGAVRGTRRDVILFAGTGPRGVRGSVKSDRHQGGRQAQRLETRVRAALTRRKWSNGQTPVTR